MNLAIFGATGGIGQQLVEQALAAGHTVTAIVRTPAKVAVQHPNLRVMQGDVLAEGTLEPAFAGQEAVLLALGVGKSREPTTLYSAGARNILQAMKAQGVPRLIAVSASGFIDDPNDSFLLKYLFKPLFQRMLKHPYDDLKRMEAEVKVSNLDWTLVRPARLTDAAHTGTYRTALNRNVAGGSAISRADVADFIVKHLDDTNVIGAAVGIAY